jgi:hypothetical protein
VLEALPVAGTEEIVERMPVEASLLTSIIHEILNSADQALELPHPGETLYPFRQSRFDVVREAALRFTQSCVIRSGDIFGGEVFEHMNEITATSYEGSAAGGHLLLASSAIDEAIDVLVRLDRSIHLRNTRAIRKLLEVTSQDFRLLIDDNGVYGIGKVREGADLEQARHAFPIEVTSHATWELRSHEAALMRVSYGVSALPRPLLDRARFRDAVLRLFPEAGDEHLDRLWDLLQAAAQASHGTILAIVDQAEAEAVRLQGESTRIHPTELTPELVSRVSGIDGAILVDSVGCCHAIGLILDGPSGEGDSARGARYNSALRYSRHPDLRTLLLVVSEDGSVELLPEQRPRVAASRVVAAIEDFREAVATGDGELYAKARARVEEISFYLDAAQCEEANSIDADEQERRRAEGGIVITGRCFEPNPEMDESYLLPQ